MAEASIFTELKRDHRRQRRLLDEIEETSRKDEDRKLLFEELRKDLQAHAAAEEESLYATMLADPELRDEARHSVSEHKEIDDLLGELVDKDPSSFFWLNKFRQMKERYLHHIDEEEQEMFPAAEERFTKAEEKRLGKVFGERKPEELERAETELPGDERE